MQCEQTFRSVVRKATKRGFGKKHAQKGDEGMSTGGKYALNFQVESINILAGK